MSGGVLQVDLVGADTEAADDQQVLGFAEDLFRQLGLGTNADDMDVPTSRSANVNRETRPGPPGEECVLLIDCTRKGKVSPDLLNELVFGQGGLESLYLVPLLPQEVLASLVDILEEEDFDVMGVKWFQGLRRNGAQLLNSKARSGRRMESCGR